MMKIRVTVCDGPCSFSMTKLVSDIPLCIKNTFEVENKSAPHCPCSINNIKLDFKDGEVLGRPGGEEGQRHV